MKEIKVTTLTAMVDDEDYDILSQHTWTRHSYGYAVRRVKRDGPSPKSVYMHREIMKPQLGCEVDHIDGNPLNNQKSNLRLCAHGKNMLNRKRHSNNTSGYKGVSFEKGVGKWRADIAIKHKSKFLGHFQSAELASEAWKVAAKEMHGEFVRLC